MDPPPARSAASKRRNRPRRRRRRASFSADAATETGSDVLAAEQGAAAQGNAVANTAASLRTRRRNRRRNRQRARAAKAAPEASNSPQTQISDVGSMQGGSSQQSGCCLESVLAHSSVSLPQTTSEKTVNSNETQERNFHTGNKTTKVYSQADTASYSPSRKNFVGGIEALRSKFLNEFAVRYECNDDIASGNADTDKNYQNEDPECLVVRKPNLSENLEETSPDCSIFHKLNEQNENEASINCSLKEEKKKRRNRKGKKNRDRCKKTTSQDCPLSNGADDSSLVVKISDENTSCLPMINSVSVNDAKTKEEDSVNLDITNTERNKLQEQDVACSEDDNDDNTGCLNRSNLAEVYADKLKDVFLQGRSIRRVPKKKLLILDLNGLLADINEDYHNAHMADAKVRGKLVFQRPYCDDFLKFCSWNFDLGIWSSRKKENVASVINIVMRDFRPQLLFCWDMSKCTFTGCKTLENMHKPLMLKELRKLWNKEEPDLPWEMGDYSPSNTLLVDDSPYKALLNPPHTAIFPRPYSYLNWNDNSLGPGGDIRVYLQNLAAADDVESYVRSNPFGQPFITENDPHWNFYAQIAGKRNAIADKGASPLTCSA